jgi:hydroxyacylglutathione hydrolase
VEIIRVGTLEITQVRTGARWKENCYVLRDLQTGEQLVIDPGANPELIGEAVDPAFPLRHVLLTHAHYDHLGAAVVLCDAHRVACHVHTRDLRLVHLAPMYARSFEQADIKAPEVVECLDDQTTFHIGTTTLEVVPTPGHTPGSVCFRADGVLFTGDTLFNARAGRTDLPGGNQEALKQSLASLLHTCPPDVVILPGHGRSWNSTEAREWWRTVPAESALPEAAQHAS